MERLHWFLLVHQVPIVLLNYIAHIRYSYWHHLNVRFLSREFIEIKRGLQCPRTLCLLNQDGGYKGPLGLSMNLAPFFEWPTSGSGQ